MKRTIACLLLFISIQEALAQGGLDTLTITSSFTKETIANTGRNITIVRGEQFYGQPVQSVDELLRYLPGIEVQQRGTAGSQSDIVLRGGTFQQVLVVLDGLRLNDPNTGHFSSYIPVTPSEIDRIEILKGASSAVYGSEAVGGVIHIITKTFAAREAKNALLAQGSMGDFGSVNTSIGGSCSNDRTTFSGGFWMARADGQPQRGIAGFYDNKTASASFRHRFNKRVDLAFRTAYDARRFAAQNFYTTFLSDTADEKVNTFWNHLRLAYEEGPTRLSFSAGYKEVDDIFRFAPASAANINHSQLWQLLALYEHNADDQKIVFGMQFFNKEIKSNDRGEHMRSQFAQFISYSRNVNAFTINPSLRFEYTENTDPEIVPGLNLAWRSARFTLRASGGKTIRDADFTERFNNWGKKLVTSGRIGNADLEVERSWSYEAGADYQLMQQIKISATLFQRHHKNLIDWTPTSYNEMPEKHNLVPTGNYALAKNIASVKTAGAEIDLQWSKTVRRGEELAATLGLLWLDSRSSSGTPSFYISSHAKFLANFNLQYSIDRFSIACNGVYKRRQPQSGAGMKTVEADSRQLNARIDARIIAKLSLFAQLENITDERTSDLLGAQLPGRRFSAGCKLFIH